VIGGALAVWIGIVAVSAIVTLVPPRVSGIETFTIRGGSMEPAIPLGSLVGVIADHDPVVGDIVSYTTSNDVVVTHRVIDVVAVDGEPHLVMQGDANEDPDPVPIHPDAVIGRVQLVFPLLGYVAWLLSIPVGLAGLATGAGTLLLLAFLLEDIESQRAERARLRLGKI